MGGSHLQQEVRTTPIIEDDRATFVWRGPHAPQLIGDFTGWQWGDPVTLAETAPGFWTHTLTLPRDAYIEYMFWSDGERVADPLNPRTVPDGLGSRVCYFYMPEAQLTPLIQRRHHVPHGRVTRHRLEQEFLLCGRRRTVLLYQPPVAPPVPLLVVLDGQDYHPRGKVVHIVENLVAQERIPPLALAMIYHGGQARGIEYSCSEAHLRVLLDLLVPLAQKELNLLDATVQPGVHGIMGASMGGLMALFAGLRAPQVFGRVLSQSGAFILHDQETVVWELVRHGPPRPVCIWMDVGRYEWLLEPNRQMHELLAERGYNVAYREYAGGHNYPSWRNDLGRGLEALFGTPDGP